MSSKKFSIAFSTIATTPFGRFLKLLSKNPVDKKYYIRSIVAGIISSVITPFNWLEQLFYSNKLERTILPASPVFILGHWRSGTTLLHNIMCKDDQFAFITTYQSVFVNQFFASRWLFKSLMKVLIPEKRPADNVLLSPDFPQEEGFALLNLKSYSYYNFWYFPKQWKIFYDEFISCKNVSSRQISFYNKQYKKLIAQSLLEHNRNGFISKNPPNTGRIRQLLEMFPDAKFVYIYRNPVTVFQSTLKFFYATLQSLQLHDISEEELRELIFELYIKIINDYENQKTLIPKQNRIEIRYEDFEQNPLGNMKTIYESLQLKGFDKAMPAFVTYLDSQKRFEKNKHQFKKKQLDEIIHRWDFALKLYGYSIPENIEVV